MNKKETTWVTERYAEGIIQLPGTFLRKSVKAGSLKALVRHLCINQCKYLYNKVDLENYIYENPELNGL